MFCCSITYKHSHTHTAVRSYAQVQFTTIFDGNSPFEKRKKNEIEMYEWMRFVFNFVLDSLYFCLFVKFMLKLFSGGTLRLFVLFFPHFCVDIIMLAITPHFIRSCICLFVSQPNNVQEYSYINCF